MNRELLSIKDIFRTLKKRIVLIGIITIISVMASIFYSYYILKPQYKTTTKLFIGKEFNGDISKYSANEVQMYQKLIRSYAGIALSEDVINRAVEKSNLNMTTSQILGSLSAIPGEEDQFLVLNMVTYDKEQGKEVLEALTDELIETSNKLIPNGSISVLTSPRVPSAPFSPNRKMYILVTLIASLLVSSSIFVFMEYMDGSVKNKNEIESLLGVPVIGMVPEYKTKLKKRKQSYEVEEELNATC